jgi:hypothetical protein
LLTAVFHDFLECPQYVVIWCNIDRTEVGWGGKKASELMNTKIDLRGGHLTINKGGRWQRKSGRGGDRRRMITNEDDESDVLPLRDIVQI